MYIRYTVIVKVQELLARNVDLKLQWILSHIGMKGNDEADIRAERAITGQVVNNYHPTQKFY